MSETILELEMVQFSDCRPIDSIVIQKYQIWSYRHSTQLQLCSNVNRRKRADKMCRFCWDQRQRFGEKKFRFSGTNFIINQTLKSNMHAHPF